MSLLCLNDPGENWKVRDFERQFTALPVVDNSSVYFAQIADGNRERMFAFYTAQPGLLKAALESLAAACFPGRPMQWQVERDPDGRIYKLLLIRFKERVSKKYRQ